MNYSITEWKRVHKGVEESRSGKQIEQIWVSGQREQLEMENFGLGTDGTSDKIRDKMMGAGDWGGRGLINRKAECWRDYLIDIEGNRNDAECQDAQMIPRTQDNTSLTFIASG